MDRLNQRLSPIKVKDKYTPAAPWAIMLQTERATGLDYDTIKNKAHIGEGEMENLKVMAIYQQNEQKFLDVNSDDRAEMYKSNGQLPFYAIGHNGSKLQLNKYQSQDQIGSAHAELGAMYQAYQNGIRGGTGDLTVYGMPCCSGCRNTNIRAAVHALAVDTLVVNECGEKGMTRTSIFIAKNNELAAKKYGGVSWLRI